MAVSLKDVAAHAKVSPATVSGVLNRSSYCWASEATAQRVLQSVKELGYVPNRAARSLRTQTFMTIGLVLPDLTNPFYAAVSRVMTERLELSGYSVVIEDNMASLANERRCYDRIIERQVDGVVASLIDPADFFKIHEADALAKPTLVMGPVPAGLEIDFVESDMGPGLTEAVGHLVNLGHTRIAFFGGKIGGVVMDDERLQIITTALASHGLAFDPELHLSSHVTLQSAFDAFSGFLHSTPRKSWPTAVIALNDWLAVAIMGAAQRHGLAVPEDLSIVGMDDIELSRYMPTPLSTISHSLKKLADEAAEILLERIRSKGRGALRTAKLPMTFIERGSTGPVPVSKGP